MAPPLLPERDRLAAPRTPPKPPSWAVTDSWAVAEVRPPKMKGTVAEATYIPTYLSMESKMSKSPRFQDAKIPKLPDSTFAP